MNLCLFYNLSYNYKSNRPKQTDRVSELHCNCEDILWSGKLNWRCRSDIGHSHKNIRLPVSATKKGQSSFKQQQRSEEKRRKRGIINLRAAAFNREVPGGMVGVKCSAGVRDNIGRQCQPFLLLCRSTIPLSISQACALQFTGVVIYWILYRTHHLQKKCFKRNKKGTVI